MSSQEESPNNEKQENVAELNLEFVDADEMSVVVLHSDLQEANPSLEAMRVRWLLVNNPNTPSQVLESIIASEHSALIRRAAEHPRLSLAVMEKLAQHEDSTIREAVAENMNLPEPIIYALAQDSCPDVRYKLAESYTIAPEVLTFLLEDENPFVAARARTTLRRRNIHLCVTTTLVPTAASTEEHFKHAVGE
jgi:hypothetical protein